MAESTSNMMPQASLRTRLPARPITYLPMVAVGMSLGLFLAITYVLCVVFDLWLPQYAMHEIWLKLLPGVTWITWPSFFLGLIESFAYGWYVALIFVPLYNFFAGRAS